MKRMVEECKQIAQQMRIDSIHMTYRLGNTGAHIGGGLSLVEIMAVLYGTVLRIDENDLPNENRDRVILSKGHGTLALYTAMKAVGLISESELLTYKTKDTFLYAHPSMNPERGIEFSSGSLGQGLSLGVGSCLAMKRKNNTKSKVYVILGDGECDEGSVWEAAQSAAHYNCNQLVAIVDCNGIQYDGPTDSIMSFGKMEEKWKAFGWDVCVVDGHDVKSLYDAFETKHDKPLAIIANTVKGKGVSYMENNPLWHNHALTKEQYEQALSELGVNI